MLTPWGETLDKANILSEYPRPQMRRESYFNLNGEWDYAITNSDAEPVKWDGKILVPFSPECELSGVGRQLRQGEYLWYRRELPFFRTEDRFIIHFGAVDQTCTVYINGLRAYRHQGGYLPFEFDAAGFLSKKEKSVLTVCVKDCTDKSYYARGKQKTERGGIWYTPQSGIWQTVWAEYIPYDCIKRLMITPDFDKGFVDINADLVGNSFGHVQFMGRDYSMPAHIPVPDFEPWSPENPKLYEFTATCGNDRVESYFAMRKFSVEKDAGGVKKLFLNGRPYFHNGLLDQGYWSDGMYTAPSDEAMIFDIQTAKDMGFNMLRKHIKIEPLRWYYHCDRLGMLVWQDMPNGGGEYNTAVVTAPLVTGIHLSDRNYRLFARDDMEGRAMYETELNEMVELLYNCPCVAMWVPFNEGWGQFDAARIAEKLRRMDPTRTVDHASGWHDQKIGDTKSLHVYFKKYSHKPDKLGRAVLLSEFGGYNLRCDGHCHNDKDFGYKKFKSPKELEKALMKLYADEIRPAYEQGLAAAVYTQLTDVEDELNGFITYDRKVVKLTPKTINNIVKME